MLQPILVDTNNFSFSFWIYPDTSGTTEILFEQGDLGATDRSLVLQLLSNDTIYLAYADTAAGIWACEVVSDEADLLTVGAWNHIIWVFNDSVASLYINGTPKTVSYITTCASDELIRDPSAQEFSIGARTDNMQNYDGLLDEFKIFNSTLTTQEVMNLHNCGDQDVACGTTPAQTQNLSGVTAPLSIALSWDDPSGTTGSTLYNGSGAVLFNQSNGTTSFIVGDLLSSTSYTFWVFSFTVSGSDTLYNTTNSSENNITLTTLPNVTVNVEILNEVNRSKIVGPNVFVNFIGTTTNASMNTTTGDMTFTGLTTENYTIRHSADGWGLRDQFLTVVANTSTNITLFLINDSFRGTVLAEVQDTRTNPLQGARIKLLRYYGVCICYEVVETAETILDGGAVMSAQLFDAFYKWVIEYRGVTELLTDIPENLFPEEDGLARKLFTIDIGNNFYNSYSIGIDAATSTIFNNVTDTLTFTWNDPTGVVTQGCVEAKFPSGINWALVGPNCVSGSSGSAFIILSNVSNTTYYWLTTLNTNTDFSTTHPSSGEVGPQTTFPLGDLGILLASGVMIGGAMLFSFSAIGVMLWSLVSMIAFFVINIATQGIVPLNLTFIAGMATIIMGFGIYLYRR